MITYNEEHHIKDALDSVKQADEIIVLDSFSEDNTVAIAREYGCTVYQEEWKGFSGQKNSVIEKATSDWVFLLDADERISTELWDEIQKTISSDSGFDGYEVPRKSYFLGRWMSHGGWWPDYVLRLFRRGRGWIPSRQVHERIVVDGGVGRLKGHLIHLAYESIGEFVEKSKGYAKLSAQEMRLDGKGFSPLKLIFSPVVTFFRMYFMRRGFLDGIHGFILAALYCYYTFLKYAFLWEDEG
ncbi:MAG: glycosyltransferase family 2 protein [Nitrospirae bacterium]|nr:MAG: glycosyltransferase family 2 protein [Nitrospirota bacterium]